RMLADLGAEVLILHTAPKSKYKGDAAYMLKGYKKVVLPEADIIIDALLGTGFSGELRPFAHAIVDAINEAKNSFIFSVDVPSGLNGLTGLPQPVAVQAQLTVTFEEAKIGLALPQADAYTGTLVVTHIGIPNEVKYKRPATHQLIRENALE
ncbi:NAD(P)H-hydrate dehydratase, partial [Aduncisulcus paluster]